MQAISLPVRRAVADDDSRSACPVHTHLAAVATACPGPSTSTVTDSEFQACRPHACSRHAWSPPFGLALTRDAAAAGWPSPTDGVPATGAHDGGTVTAPPPRPAASGTSYHSLTPSTSMLMAALRSRWCLLAQMGHVQVTADPGARSSSRWVSALRAPSHSGGFPPRSWRRLLPPLVPVSAGYAGTGISDAASPSLGWSRGVGGRVPSGPDQAAGG